jgi:CBS domain-containing protein
MTAVHDIMSTSPVTVAPTTSIGNLLALFDRHDFNAFPVVGQCKRLLGIVSKLDVLELLLGHPKDRSSAAHAFVSTYVADVMCRKPIFVEPREALSAAGKLMVVTKLRSLPVVAQRERRPVIVGILSRGDVLRGLRSELMEDIFIRQEKAS